MHGRKLADLDVGSPTGLVMKEGSLNTVAGTRRIGFVGLRHMSAISTVYIARHQSPRLMLMWLGCLFTRYPTNSRRVMGDFFWNC